MCFRYNAEYTDFCTPMEIERIEWATKMVPNEGLLKFHQAVDTDGFVPDMSANTKFTKIYLQLKVVTRPANAMFEFSCQYNKNTDEYQVYVSHIMILIHLFWQCCYLTLFKKKFSGYSTTLLGGTFVLNSIFILT